MCHTWSSLTDGGLYYDSLSATHLVEMFTNVEADDDNDYDRSGRSTFVTLRVRQR